ncbi:30S ribosomal protein S1 [Lyticum sinuosum]|uniref:30S ribosomal protein S1 n=1 Tax=Lyticum sinuosum TaxID=1332059 RepID=A0AAE4VJS1_9RICK|nr:30S ribosomal protein S1 [Lyticum sinuosum]MDZ5761151.1 30S ribosomal protein S1 [Lyticum sinuosum]
MSFSNLQEINLEPNDQNLQEDYIKLLEEHFQSEVRENTLVKGTVIDINNDAVIVDVSFKSAGRIPISEFVITNQKDKIKIGDVIDVYVDKLEGRDGCIVLSRERAVKEKIWLYFENAHTNNETVDGIIIGRVKGGFAVDLGGLVSFLPGSQVDIRPIKDISALGGIIQSFKILKMDKTHGNIVVSRRAIMEESRKEARDDLISTIEEGMILEGVVKNITGYGAFVDLGPIDGLIHIRDLDWDRKFHPSEVLTVGQKIKVMVIKYNKETQRISLGLKQLTKNPWEEITKKYSVGSIHKGKITAITDYGAFVMLEPNVDGLVYHTELHWTARNVHPSKIVSVGQEVDVMVLDFDLSKHRISLSVKHCQKNAWEEFIEKHPQGSRLSVVVRNISDFGIFVSEADKINDELSLNLLIPIQEIDWSETLQEEILRKYSKGDIIECVIINADPQRERITGSIKRLSEDNLLGLAEEMMKKQSVEVIVTDVKRDGIEVEIKNGITAYIDRYELSNSRNEQKPQNFTIGQKVNVKVVKYDSDKRVFNLSIKELHIENEQKMKEDYQNAQNNNFGSALSDALKLNDK